MSAPYTKETDGDEWEIYDCDGDVLATCQTERLADAVLAVLLGDFTPKQYPIDTELGTEDTE
jgi:hypothetical protein